MKKISREVKTGIVIAAALFLFIWGINYLKGTDIFTKQIRFYVVYEETIGLMETNPVSISGVKVGHIDRIFLHPDGSGNVVVECIIERKIGIPDNTIARLHTSGLVGTREIDLILGDSPDNIEPGDTLPATIQPKIQEELLGMITPVRKKLEDVLWKADSVLLELNLLFTENTRQNLSKSIEDLQKSMASIQQITNVADTTLLNNAPKLASIVYNVESISNNLKKNNEAITHIIKNLESISDTLVSADIAQTISNANKSLESFGKVMEKIDRGEGSLGLLVHDDSLYINLSKSSMELEQLLEDIRKNPQKYINISVFGRKY